MEVTFDFGSLLQGAQATPDYSPVAKTMLEASAVIVSTVHAAYTGTVLPGMTRQVNNPTASNSVHVEMDGLLAFRVQTPDDVEQAVGPYDMKPGLLRGPKHRINKKGQPYNIVPFTHKGADLPGAVAEMASQLTLSAMIGSRLEVRGDDQWEVTRNVYAWGSNLGAQEDSRHSNMYRFGDDAYVTFRTVSTKSPANSWIHPGYAANPITDSAWKLMAPSIEAALAAAWEEALSKPWQS